MKIINGLSILSNEIKLGGKNYLKIDNQLTKGDRLYIYLHRIHLILYRW